jgi:branched-chain amino acid transport system permease protein
MRLLHTVKGPLCLTLCLIGLRYLFPGKTTFFLEIVIFTIYVMGNDVLYGYMGMASLGQPFYLGVGAYAAALYLYHVGHNPFIAMALSVASGTLVGVVFGPPYLRLRGDYFALINASTCAMGLFLVEKILLPITRGDDGLIFRTKIFPVLTLDLRKTNDFFWFSMAILFLVHVFYVLFSKSTLGTALRALKSRETKMSFLGYDTFKLRWTGYVLMCMLTSLAGAMYAINYGFVNPNVTDPARAVEVLVATLLGGTGTVYGPFFGASAFIGMRDIVSAYTNRWELPVGVITLFVCFRFRDGIFGYLRLIPARLVHLLKTRGLRKRSEIIS